jgi:hypothetical protein
MLLAAVPRDKRPALSQTHELDKRQRKRCKLDEDDVRPYSTSSRLRAAVPIVIFRANNSNTTRKKEAFSIVPSESPLAYMCRANQIEQLSEWIADGRLASSADWLVYDPMLKQVSRRRKLTRARKFSALAAPF